MFTFNYWWLRLHFARYRFDYARFRMLTAIVWRLPRWLIYLASIRMVAHATTGQFSNTEVTQLSAMEAVKRWEIPHQVSASTSTPNDDRRSRRW